MPLVNIVWLNRLREINEMIFQYFQLFYHFMYRIIGSFFFFLYPIYYQKERNSSFKCVYRKTVIPESKDPGLWEILENSVPLMTQGLKGLRTLEDLGSLGTQDTWRSTIFCKIYSEFTRFHQKSWFEVKV